MKEYKGYKISEDGRVFNKKGDKELYYNVNHKGYKRVALFYEGKSKKYFVHRLVAMLYVENPNNKNQVNHIDGDKLNNHYTNLEWVTNKENNSHARRLNLMPGGVLDKDAIVDIYYNLTSKEAVEKYGISRFTYYDVKKLRYPFYKECIGK